MQGHHLTYYGIAQYGYKIARSMQVEFSLFIVMTICWCMGLARAGSGT